MKKMPADKKARLEALASARVAENEHARKPSRSFLDKADIEAGLGNPEAANSSPSFGQREMRSELVPLSRQLARVLRHKPEIWSVTLDAQGWCGVTALMDGAAAAGLALSLDDLHEIVATNNKGRFSTSPDGLRIRAVQGHSVPVDLNLRTVVPPPVLYHGTVRKHLSAIRRQGLLPMSRHAVHLSATRDAAAEVGGRRGPAVVLVVDTYAMQRAGFEFKQAENGVWLAESVPPQFLWFHVPSQGRTTRTDTSRDATGRK